MMVVKPRVDASIVFVEAVPAPSRTRVSRLEVRRGPPRTTCCNARRTVTPAVVKAAIGYAVMPVRFLIYMWFSGKLIS